jgi:hypothetical protein
MMGILKKMPRPNPSGIIRGWPRRVPPPPGPFASQPLRLHPMTPGAETIFAPGSFLRNVKQRTRKN